MRRRLFFWLDKLKITRTERQAISILLIIFAALYLLNAIISPSSPFDDEYYSELDARFQMRTALMQQEEEHILSRYRGEAASITSSDTLAPDSTAEQSFADIPKAALININTANASELQQLRGIGAAYSQRIIEYRQQNGSFKTPSELLNIKGIGKIRLRKISPFILLGDEDNIEIKEKIEVEDEAEVKVKVEDDEVEDRLEAQAQSVSPADDSSVEASAKIKNVIEGNIMVMAEGESKSENEVKDDELKIEGKATVEAGSKTEVEDKVKVKNEVESKDTFTINVNKANATALQNLSGVGPAYARRILEYRQLNGPFETKEQLLDIKGIGEKRLAKIKPFIKLTDQY